MSNRTPHVIGGGLGTFRAKDKDAWTKRQAAAKVAQDAQTRANNAAIMRSMGEHRTAVSLAKV